jgi:AcrR family transcriptional regulator
VESVNEVQKGASNEQKILEAAKKVFLRDGLHGSRMETIAKEAGVTKALLHYYFRSKEKLFAVIFEEVKGGMLPRLESVFGSDLPVFEKIERFVESYIDLLIENPYIPLFLVNEVNKDPEKFFETTQIAARIQQFVPHFVQQILEEQEKGNLNSIHPFHLIINVMSLCIFPFLGKPMFQKVAGMTDEQYKLLLQERKKEVAAFVMRAIKIPD